MNIDIRKVRSYYEVSVETDDIKVTTGLLSREEACDLLDEMSEAVNLLEELITEED